MHKFSITVSSPDIALPRTLFGVSDPQPGTSVHLDSDCELLLEDVIERMGIAESSILLTAAITVGTSISAGVATALLTKWLDNKLFGSAEKLKINGIEIDLSKSTEKTTITIRQIVEQEMDDND